MGKQQHEAKFVNDWLHLNYPNELHITRQHLGSIAKKDVAAAYGVLMNWVDALVLLPDKVVMVEAKLRNEIKGIGQLLVYENLFRETPKFTRYHHLPIEKILLVLRNVPAVKTEAERHGIEYVQFKPKWLLDALGLAR